MGLLARGIFRRQQRILYIVRREEKTITQRLFLQQHQNLFIKPRENTSDPPLQHIHLETTLQFNRQRRMDRTLIDRAVRIHHPQAVTLLLELESA